MAEGKLRRAGEQTLTFMCPGCREPHQVDLGRWSFNGSMERPTFSPSLLVRSGHHAGPGDCWCTWNAANPGEPSGFACQVCHSFITDGQIQFLSDCTHALAGRTVPLPDWPGFEA